MVVLSAAHGREVENGLPPGAKRDLESVVGQGTRGSEPVILFARRDRWKPVPHALSHMPSVQKLAAR